MPLANAVSFEMITHHGAGGLNVFQGGQVVLLLDLTHFISTVSLLNPDSIRTFCMMKK
jgi:hypothetical protein